MHRIGTCQRCTGATLLSVALFFLESPAMAQPRPAGQDTARQPLSAITQLRCVFPIVALAAWSSGAPAPPRVKNDIVLSFNLYAIDSQGGSAHLVGGPSAPEVFVVAQSSPWGMHFIENESTGTISLTSVFMPQSPGGKFRAVHARSSYLPVALPGSITDPTIAQYSGECEPVH
jgi:hypothetical protein